MIDVFLYGALGGVAVGVAIAVYDYFKDRRDSD